MPNPIPICVGSIAESVSAAIGAVAGAVVGSTRWAPSAYVDEAVVSLRGQSGTLERVRIRAHDGAVSLCGQGGPLEPVRRRRHRAVVGVGEAVLPEGCGSTDGERGDGDCDDE